MESSTGQVVTLNIGDFADFGALQERLARVADDARVAVLLFDGGLAPAVPPSEAQWLERLTLPVVGAVSGPVASDAAVLALGCDIRVADAGAHFTLRPAGGPRVITLLGQRGAIAVAQRGGELDAVAALELGLVSRLAGARGAAALAEQVAAAVALRGPLATRLAKEAIWRGLPQPLEQALRFETDLTLLLQSTQDRAEGVRAFIEKRTPNFTGQ